MRSVAINISFYWIRNGQSLHKTDSGPRSWFASERSAGAFGDRTTWVGSVARNTQ